jgi:hypothetical protein
MKKLIIKTVLFVFCSLFGVFVFAQAVPTPSVIWHANGSVTVVGEKTFIYKSESLNLETNIAFNYKKALPLSSDFDYGIRVSGIVDTQHHDLPETEDFSITGDGVQLFVNFYDLSKNEKLKLVYGAFANNNDEVHYQEGYWTQAKVNFKQLYSHNYKELAIQNKPAASVNIYSATNRYGRVLELHLLPVQIEVKVKNATLHEVNIPGIGIKKAAELFNNPSIFNAQLAQIKRVFEAPRYYDYSIVAAHRGYWAEPGVPENTIAAFYRAYEIGADLIEVDVRLTKDGIPVACHDDFLYRLYDVTDLANHYDVANWQLRIGMITASQFKTLKTKDRFGKDLDIHPNTIAEILDEFKYHLISLDIKDVDNSKSNSLLWSSSFKKCLLLALSKNVLHNMVIKGKPKMTVTETMGLFAEVNYNSMSIRQNPELKIDFTKFYFTPVMYGRYDPNNNGAAIVKDDIYEAWKPYWEDGSVKAAECHFKVGTDPLLYNYVNYLHDNNIRVGIYNYYADMPTGVNTMEADGTLGVRAYTPNIDYSELKKPDSLTDNRGNLDWCMEVGKTNYFIYDRPVMLINMLEAAGMRNLIDKLN